jgi:hypothetical protein
MVTQVNLGTINRLRATVSFQDHPELNVSAVHMGKDMISWNPQGDMTKAIPAAVGSVNSPEPWMPVEFSIEILKTTGIADRYKQQWEKYSVLGDSIVRGDASAFGDVPVFNTSIKGVDQVKFNGDQATITVHLQGYYIINSDLYNV